MRGITVRDTDTEGSLSFDLRDLLELVGPRARQSTWRLESIECLGGPLADVLHDASDAGHVLSGDELARLAAGVVQVIDGEFRAFLAGAAEPWLVIRAVDSSAFDVETDDGAVLAAIATRFHSVSEIPT